MGELVLMKELQAKALDSAKELLTNENFEKFVQISESVNEAWNKRQVFRTETEMKYSVLNDGDFPTRAAKYWQCIREQSAMLDNLIIQSFEYRKNEVKIKKKMQEIESLEDPLDKEMAQIELEELLFGRESLKQVCNDRMREIVLWENFKKQLDDGTFDNKNVNTHQKETFEALFQHRLAQLTPNTSYGERHNIVSLAKTLFSGDIDQMLNSNNQLTGSGTQQQKLT